MKKNLLRLAAATLLGIVANASTSNAQNAELQIIHNCADPAAEFVDVYLDTVRVLDDFMFREATPYLPIPPGTYTVGVASSTSTSVADTLKSFTVVLDSNERYVAVASGVVNPASFSVNPDGEDINFTLNLRSGMRNASVNGTDVDFIVLHGSTDAPAVDVVPMGSPNVLVDNAAYFDFSNYITVAPTGYKLNITPANDNSVIVASYDVDLTGLSGGAATVFASGFLDPTANQNGPAFGLFAALPNGTVVQFAENSTSRLQVIHNSADPAAAVVDIYVDTTLFLNDFAFRTASPFVDVPSGVTLNIGIAPASSTSSAQAIATIPVTLASGQTYVAIANGVLDATQFAANPSGLITDFSLFIQSGITESSSNSGDVRFLAFHGATDAPEVDVVTGGSPVVDNLLYGNYSGALEVPAASYVLNVTPSNDNSTIVASYLADLSSLGGGAAVVFASGFLDPTSNQNGEAFGLFAALTNGTVVAFPANNTARLQVIHNAADPGATTVDIYADTTLLLDDFSFRTATPFINVPAGVSINLGIAPPNSTSSSQALATIPVSFTAGQTYVAVANGVLNPAGFAANPDAVSTAFQLLIQSGVSESSGNAGAVRFFALHGATDAPTVDVIPMSSATPLIDDLTYAQFSATLDVPPASYILNVTPGANNTAVVASYVADLSSLGGGSAVVFASGFLDPSTNQNGQAFGLFAALADGSVLQLPLNTSARIQVIHNAADPAASSVDVYAGSTQLIDDFDFREATAFIDVPAGVAIPIGIAPASSASAADTIPGIGTTFTLTAGQTYAVIANGVTAPGSFAVNPDGRSTAFTFFVKEGVRTSAAVSSEVDFVVLHGATDAPTVDVIANGALTIVNDAAYGDITNYINVPAASYALGITPAAGAPVLLTYTADLTTLAGGAAVVFASGFLDPATNQNGPGFGLYAALPNGTVIPFTNTTSVSESIEIVSGLYPNPSSQFVNIAFTKREASTALVVVTDVTGRVVLSTTQELGAASTARLDVSSLSNGLYQLSVVTAAGYDSRSFLVSR